MSTFSPAKKKKRSTSLQKVKQKNTMNEGHKPRSWINSGKLLKAKGNLEQVEQSTAPMKGIGPRHGKTEEQKEYHIAFNAWKSCRKRIDGQEEHYECIHDRFLRDQVYRESQLAIGWTEPKCIEMDELAKQDHSYRLSREEFKRYQGQWYLLLNKSGKNAPMRLRSDFRAAVSLKNRLHREAGEERAEPFPFQQYQRWHPSSSSDSWWNWDTSKSWWNS